MHVYLVGSHANLIRIRFGFDSHSIWSSIGTLTAVTLHEEARSKGEELLDAIGDSLAVQRDQPLVPVVRSRYR